MFDILVCLVAQRSRSRSRSRDRSPGRKHRHHDSRSRSPYRSRSRSKDQYRSHDRRSRSRSRSRSYSPAARSPSPYSRRRRSRSRSGERRRSRSRSYERHRSRSPRRQHRSRSPNEEDDVTDTFIRTVAAEVIGHGKKYEDNLKEREKGNAKYGFLTNSRVRTLRISSNHNYCTKSPCNDMQHRRHRYYLDLVKREHSDDLQFDDEVSHNAQYPLSCRPANVMYRDTIASTPPIQLKNQSVSALERPNWENSPESGSRLC